MVCILSCCSSVLLYTLHLHCGLQMTPCCQNNEQLRAHTLLSFSSLLSIGFFFLFSGFLSPLFFFFWHFPMPSSCQLSCLLRLLKEHIDSCNSIIYVCFYVPVLSKCGGGTGETWTTETHLICEEQPKQRGGSPPTDGQTVPPHWPQVRKTHMYTFMHKISLKILYFQT